MLSFFAAQVEKEKVWDLERVWFWLVTEECVEAEEEGRRNRRCSTDDRISKLGSDHSFACSVSRWMDHHRLYLLLNLLDLPLLMPIVLSYVISVTLPIFSVCFLGKCICSLFVYLFILQFYLLGVTQSLLFR